MAKVIVAFHNSLAKRLKLKKSRLSFKFNVTVKQIDLVLRVLEVSVSNLGWETGSVIEIEVQLSIESFFSTAIDETERTIPMK
jgi:hypothetical protein